MTKYRPEGWVNPYPKEGLAQPENIPWNLLHDMIEAGADLMLDKLRETGEYFDLKGIEVIHVPVLFRNKVKGTFVFIPDDKEG